MKLYAVSGFAGSGLNVDIYAADSLESLATMLSNEPYTEERVNSHLDNTHYLLTFKDNTTRYVEEAEVKPGRLFSIIE